MKPLVGEGREPLLLMFGLLALSIPFAALFNLPYWLASALGGVVFVGCIAAGVRRISADRAPNQGSEGV